MEKTFRFATEDELSKIILFISKSMDADIGKFNTRQSEVDEKIDNYLFIKESINYVVRTEITNDNKKVIFYNASFLSEDLEKDILYWAMVIFERDNSFRLADDEDELILKSEFK